MTSGVTQRIVKTRLGHSLDGVACVYVAGLGLAKLLKISAMSGTEAKVCCRQSTIGQWKCGHLWRFVVFLLLLISMHRVLLTHICRWLRNTKAGLSSHQHSKWVHVQALEASQEWMPSEFLTQLP